MSNRLTLAQAAEIARCHPSTLRLAIKRGTLRAVKYGKTWTVTRQALDAWIASDVHRPGVKGGR